MNRQPQTHSNTASHQPAQNHKTVREAIFHAIFNASYAHFFTHSCPAVVPYLNPPTA
jgi:hypothetical protein